MNVRVKPVRWQGSDEAIRAVQVAFDVEEAVLEAVRTAAFEQHVSTSDQIRQVLGLATTSRPKRPRLTVSLSGADYEFLAKRYGLAADDRLAIKERATRDLIAFASGASGARSGAGRLGEAGPQVEQRTTTRSREDQWAISWMRWWRTPPRSTRCCWASW
jgi:hypothetical protein